MLTFLRKNGLALLLVAALMGVYALGQWQARDRERAFLAQLRLQADQFQKDRESFQDTIRAMASRPGQPVNITLPSMQTPGTVRLIERGPNTVRFEVKVTQPVSQEKAKDLEKAGATAIDLTIKPLDLRGLPADQRKAGAVQDPATGAFACVEGTLCEDATTRQTISLTKPEPPQSKSKLIVGFPAGVGFAYEVWRLDPPLIGRIFVDALVFAWPIQAAGVGLSKPVWRSFDLGVGVVAGIYTGPVVYASWHLP